jgi:hypothetical protein
MTERWHTVHVEYPGTWIDDADVQWGESVRHALAELENPLVDMAIALSMFDGQNASLATASKDWHRDRNERMRITEEVKRELDVSPFDMSGEQEVQRIVARRSAEARSERGEVPSGYRKRLPFVHARTFLLAQDRLERLLANVKQLPRVPGTVSAAIDSFCASIVREVRNSVAHYEDRTSGLRMGGKPIPLQPVDSGDLRMAGNVLMLECLNGNRFGSTMADGHYGEVEVSIQTLRSAEAIVKEAVNGFKWKGPPNVLPY